MNISRFCGIIKSGGQNCLECQLIFQTFKVLRDFMELFIWSMNQYCVSWIIEDANAWVSGYEIKKKWAGFQCQWINEKYILLPTFMPKFGEVLLNSFK